MTIYYDLLELLFFGSIIYMIYILLIFIHKGFDFFVMKNENTRFELNNVKLIMFWVSLTFILSKIF